MKAKLIIPALFSVLLLGTSCQKEKITATDYITEVETQTDDQSRFSTEIDAVANDVNVVLESTSGFSGFPGDPPSQICDADVLTDTLSNPRTIKITYKGTACLRGRKRTGSVLISMQETTRWKNDGAVITVKFQDLKVWREYDNKNITISGTQEYTNVSGGLLINLFQPNLITHTITSGSMNLTFDNGNQRVWKVARRRVYSHNNGIIITTTGMHTDAGIPGISEWGTNRFGHEFTTPILVPLVIKQSCDFRQVSGKVEQSNSLFNATVNFGLDSAGNPTGCAAGDFYLRIIWTGPSGTRRTAMLKYQ